MTGVQTCALPISAIINFKSNDTPQTFTWNGANTDSELENISVFNSSCVLFSISDRSLIVTPIGFHLFQLVSDELNVLTQMLNRKIAAYPTTLIWLENLTIGTPQYNFISSLSSTSTVQILTELSDFSPAHQVTLSAKETELVDLNKTLLQSQILTMKIQIQELDSIKIGRAHV